MEEKKGIIPNESKVYKDVLWATEGVFNSLEERLIWGEKGGVRAQELVFDTMCFSYVWVGTDESECGEGILAALLAHKVHHHFTWHIVLWKLSSLLFFHPL